MVKTMIKATVAFGGGGRDRLGWGMRELSGVIARFMACKFYLKKKKKLNK